MSFLHHRRGARRCIRKARAGRRRGHAGEIDVVLDDEGYAVQGQLLRRPAFERGDIGHDLVTGQAGNPHMMRIVFRGLLEQRFHDGRRREFPGAIAVAESRNQKAVWWRHARNHNGAARDLHAPIRGGDLGDVRR